MHLKNQLSKLGSFRVSSSLHEQDAQLLEYEWCERADAKHLVRNDLLVHIGLGFGVQEAQLLDLHLASSLASQFTLTFNSTHGQSH